MRRTERANVDWQTPHPTYTWDHVQVELLMDIRDELQKLNRLLHCQNFVRIPTVLDGIQRNTRKPVKRKPLKAAK